MCGHLKSDLYKILPLTGGYLVGVDPTLPTSQFVRLNELISESNWEVRQVAGNAYRLSVGGYQYTGELDQQVNASIHSDHGQDWYIIYSQHDDAYLITVDPQGHKGWTVTGGLKSQLKIAPIIATKSIPPQFAADQLFKFSVEHAKNTLLANVRWRQGMHQTFPQYFPDPKVRQEPRILWIGCSDSRVQESDATTALPGAVFVHRNIANQFHFHTEPSKLSDVNALSVLEYSLFPLGIQHVVVVGHDHCGGVISAIETVFPSSPTAKAHHDCILRDSVYHPPESLQEDQPNENPEGLRTTTHRAIRTWLEPLVELVRQLRDAGKLPSDPEKRLKFVTEENVKLQVNNIVKFNDFVRRHARKRPVWVHGWVYNFSNGAIRDLQVTKVLGA